MTITVTASNGEAPPDALAVLPGYNGDGTPHTAPHVTAASYARLRAAMQAAGMGDLLPTADGWSCYRDRAAQQHMIDIGLSTIPVGQSIHGEWDHGSAVDFQGLGGFGADRHEWLRHHGAEYGWYQPGWAQQWGSLPEPWHWEYDERDDAHAGEESDMTPEQAAQLEAASEDASEARRILAFMVTGTGAKTDAEANYVHQTKELAADAGEARRMLGVELGWNPPAPGSPEVTALPKLWGQVSRSGTPWQTTLALIVAIAILIGLVVALIHARTTGVYTGTGALIGGVVGWIGATLRRADGT